MHRRKDFICNFGRQATRFGTEHPEEAHRAVPVERRLEGRPIGSNALAGRLVRTPRHLCEESVRIAPRDGGSHCGFGGKMMMDARALDADLGRKVAKAEAAISRVAHMAFRQVHQSLGCLVHDHLLYLSIDRP
jgi:hypothetical protein